MAGANIERFGHTGKMILNAPPGPGLYQLSRKQPVYDIILATVHPTTHNPFGSRQGVEGHRSRQSSNN